MSSCTRVKRAETTFRRSCGVHCFEIFMVSSSFGSGLNKPVSESSTSSGFSMRQPPQGAVLSLVVFLVCVFFSNLEPCDLIPLRLFVGALLLCRCPCEAGVAPEFFPTTRRKYHRGRNGFPRCSK